ncbi:polyprotein [Glycine max]|nr:polyprotein [Glycine max]
MGNRALMKGVPKITSFLRKTFFSWGSGMELIASNKRSCSLVRVLICPSSSSVDDSWSSCWIRFRFSSESTEDEVSVSSSEVSMSKLFICSSIAVFADVALFSTIVARFSIPLLVDGLCEYLLLGNLFVLIGMLEVVSNPLRFTVGNWLCDSDLVSPTGIERVLTEKDLLADSYSDLEASILDEKEFLLLKVISTFPELSCLICSMVGAGRGIDGVALFITHLSGRVTSSHFIFLGRDTLAFVISVINKLILRDFWNVPVIHVLINIFESDFLIEEIVFWGDLLGLRLVFLEEDEEEEFERKEIREKDRNNLDIIKTFSNIFAFIWFNRNLPIRLYVSEERCSETRFLSNKFLFFILLSSPSTDPVRLCRRFGFFVFKNLDPRSSVTYSLMGRFLWNQMKAKILENVLIMSRLLRSFSRISFRSNSSSSSSSRNTNLLNDQDNQTQEVAPKHNLFDEEVRFEDINQNMDDWNIPEIPQDQLYVPETIKDKHNFDYIIKTVENNIPLGQDIGEEFHLLSKNSIYEHSRKYKYLHIGCVQVAIKPLIDMGIDAAVLMCLRDIRHNQFEDSLIGTVEISLGQGPIYFNCYPNKTVSLMDRNILDSLFLNIF